MKYLLIIPLITTEDRAEQSKAFDRLLAALKPAVKVGLSNAYHENRLLHVYFSKGKKQQADDALKLANQFLKDNGLGDKSGAILEVK